MLDFMKILNNDTSNFTEEEKAQAEQFTNTLKERIIDDLVEIESQKLIEKLKNDKEDFKESISQILINGCMGYKKMSMQLLINIYLEKAGNERFIELMEKL